MAWKKCLLYICFWVFEIELKYCCPISTQSFSLSLSKSNTLTATLEKQGHIQHSFGAGWRSQDKGIYFHLL